MHAGPNPRQSLAARTLRWDYIMIGCVMVVGLVLFALLIGLRPHLHSHKHQDTESHVNAYYENKGGDGGDNEKNDDAWADDKFVALTKATLKDSLDPVLGHATDKNGIQYDKAYYESKESVSDDAIVPERSEPVQPLKRKVRKV